MQLDPLNTPERFIDDVSSVTERMEKVDAVLGEARLQNLARATSMLLAHGNPECSGLAQALRSSGSRLSAEVFTLLAAARSEIETGWNALRLGNIGAAYRQSRIASEFIALVVLSCLPRRDLLTIPTSIRLHKLLRQFPEASVLDLWKPSRDAPDDAPRLKAHEVIPPFLYVAENVLNLGPSAIKNLREARRQAQNPLSHGSELVRYLQVFGADGRTMGINYSPSKDRYYRQAADELVVVVANSAKILDVLTAYLITSEEPPTE